MIDENRDDYVWKGDTWWMIEDNCPECGERLGSNGKIDDCSNCDWWEPLTIDD